MFNLDDLNDEQKKPALDTEGVLLVTAGAGSGKTRLLTYRIIHILKDLKVSPYNVLAITFTNKATKEMKERIELEYGENKGLWISTFHSMCVRILRENADHIDGYNRNFTIYDSSDRDKLIGKVIKSLGLDEEKELKKKASYEISNAKNNGQTPAMYLKEKSFDFDAEKIAKIYETYEQELKNNVAFDFDDLLTKTVELFKRCPEVLGYYQERFQYIHVDEFQDTNAIQYELVKMLADKHRNLFVVGDEDQCIYGWRGANIENIQNLLRDFGAKHYKLERNYRSTKKIIDKANHLIKNNSQRLDKTLWTNNEDGDDLVYYEAYDETAEAEYVARNIYNMVARGEYKYSDIAILSRMSALTMQFEQKLLNYNIPYIIYGNIKFFDRAIIKNIMAYLRVVCNPKDNENLSRIINFPKRGIGKTSIDTLGDIARMNGVSMLEVITNPDLYGVKNALKTKLQDLAQIFIDLGTNVGNMQITDFCSYMIARVGIKNEFKENTEENKDALLHISQFLQNVESFSKENEEATLQDYIESITLESTYEESDDKDSVVLSTIHASKGLEFNVVFVVGAEENIFPITRAESESDIEEERRLMYVAITRAKKKVYITRSKSRFLYGNRNYSPESRFIKELGLSNKPIVASPAPMFNGSRHSDIDYSEGNGFASKSSSTVSIGNAGLSDFIKKAQAKKQSSNFAVGDQVFHTKFGNGKIIKVENMGGQAYASIDFGALGVKTLSLSIAPLQKI